MSKRPPTGERDSILQNVAVQEWILRGESLLQKAIEEYHAIDARLDALEAHLVTKGAEVEQLAAVLGQRVDLKKRRLAAELLIEQPVAAAPAPKEREATKHVARSISARFIREAPAMVARIARMAMGRSATAGRSCVQSHTF